MKSVNMVALLNKAKKECKASVVRADVAKAKQKAQDEVNELMEHTPGGVSVPVDVPAATTTSTAKSAPLAADTPVEDEDFLKVLEEMEG